MELAPARPVTAPGALGVVDDEPCPSCPNSFAPQQEMPLVVTAQLWRSPSASSCAAEMPGTVTGPLPAAPSCSERFAPQHTTPPVPARMAQAWPSPTATELAVPTPGTSIGLSLKPATTAQVVSPPAASAPAGQQPWEGHWKKPGLQVKPQLLASHLLVACCGVAQTNPHAPQLFTSLSVDTQAGPPQSCWGKVHCSRPTVCRSIPPWSTRPAPQAAERKRAGRRRFIGPSRTARRRPANPAGAASTRRSA